jgi:hypothetical protein
VICSTSYLTQLLATVRQMQQLQLLASQQESAVIKLQSAWRVSTRLACKHLQQAVQQHCTWSASCVTHIPHTNALHPWWLLLFLGYSSCTA